MARVVAYQPVTMRHAQAFLQNISDPGHRGRSQEIKLQILEAAAARIGGFDIKWYWEHQSVRPLNGKLVDKIAENLVSEIGRTNFHPAICLAALATPNLAKSERRMSGSYFTDFRLAQYLASKLDPTLLRRRSIIDPACGSGILLVASVLHFAAYDRKKASHFLGSSVVGIDKNPLAVRAAALSLSALTSDKRTITSLLNNLEVADSIIAVDALKSKFAPSGFGAVITNPPWEKIKITRHEYLAANGIARHYGDDYSHSIDGDDFVQEVDRAKKYSRTLSLKYKLTGGKEIDLYSVFLELCLDIAASDGQISILVPAGLIRSQSTERLRTHFFESCSVSKISIFENRARFFDIDTRFKFLTVYGQKGQPRNSHSVILAHPRANETSITDGDRVVLPGRSLRRVRRDLSVPEVRNRAEWQLFQKIAQRHPSLLEWGKAFGMSFMREIDMTKDRHLFNRKSFRQSIPLVEGRMVHQYSSTAKSYLSGTGRRAKWISQNKPSTPRPQFWIERGKLPHSVLNRIRHVRAGFCDITGQTNERSMLAAFIPKNAVCGNKVPTIAFSMDVDDLVLPSVFLSIVNSFVFDWLLRRICTTTVNYFILQSVPFPQIDIHSPLAARLTQLVQRLSSRSAPFGRWEDAEIRTEIEALILRAYNLTMNDLELMMKDFPLLDRGECPIRGELRSTITRDFTLLKCANHLGHQTRQFNVWTKRVDEAKAQGAVPYRPSHLVKDESDHFYTESAGRN